jgi:hypothetical protein
MQLNQTVWLKNGFRESSITVKTVWKIIEEFNKSMLDKAVPIKPVFVSTAATAGEIHAYNSGFDASSSTKRLKVPVGKEIPNKDLIDDKIMI